ncbi:hypothetical protein CSC81_17325, partial [Tenacibaculum discolor]
GVFLEHDALQQVLRRAVLLLLDEQVGRNTPAAVVRVHARVARVVHATPFAADVQLAARDHGQARQHVRAPVVLGPGQHEPVADDLGRSEGGRVGEEAGRR